MMTDWKKSKNTSISPQQARYKIIPLLHMEVEAQGVVAVVYVFDFYNTASAAGLTATIERSLFWRTNNVT